MNRLSLISIHCSTECPLVLRLCQCIIFVQSLKIHIDKNQIWKCKTTSAFNVVHKWKLKYWSYLKETCYVIKSHGHSVNLA